VAMFTIILFFISLDQYVIFSKCHSYSKIESQNRSKTIEYLVQIKNPSAKTFAYMPRKSPEPPYVIHLDAMMAAQNLNMATVNGYSGNFPRSYIAYFQHYDSCGSYWAWMLTSTKKYSDFQNAYRFFKDVMIIGSDTCI
jgi:hypothetical protein